MGRDESGIEAIEGATSPSIVGLTSRYVVYPDRLSETTQRGDRTYFSWPVHMADKNWVDIDTFNEAFAKAIEYHQDGGLAAIDRKMLEDSFRLATTERARG